MRVPVTPSPFAQKEVAPGVTPGVDFKVEVNPEAVGTGPSAERAGKAAEGLITQGMDEIEKKKVANDQIRANLAASQLMSFKNQAVAQAQNTKGEAAIGNDENSLLAQAQTAYKNKYDEVTKDLSNDTQRNLVLEHSTRLQGEMESQIVDHVLREKKELDDSSTGAIVHNLQNDMVSHVGDEKAMGQDVEKMKLTLAQYGLRNGHSDELVTENTRTMLSVPYASIVDNLVIKGQPAQARQFFEAHKNEIDANRWDTLEKQIQTGETLDKSQKMWPALRNMTLSDGSPDEARMERNVFGRKDLNEEQKDQVWGFVKARANEEFRQKTQQKEASKTAFENDLVTAVSSGADPATVHKLVFSNKYGAMTPNDIAQRTALVNAAYAAPKESDAIVYSKFYNDMQSGQPPSQDDLNQALKDRQLTLKDFQSLGGQLSNQKVKGVTTDDKITNPRIKAMLDTHFTDKSNEGQIERGNFEAWVTENTKGLSVDDKLKKVAAALGDPGKDNQYKGIDWKVDADKRRAQPEVWKQLDNTLGSNVVNDLKAGLGPKATADDVKALIETYTPLENYQGSNINRAIQDLTRHNYPVTKRTLDAYFIKHPNINEPGGTSGAF